MKRRKEEEENGQIPEEVLKLMDKLPLPPPPRQLSAPQFAVKTKGKGYTCSICGAKFDTLTALGTHCNKERAEWRKHLTQRPQIGRVPPSKPKNLATVRIERMQGARRIYITHVVPKDWELVRLASVPEGKNAVWIYMEKLI